MPASQRQAGGEGFTSPVAAQEQNEKAPRQWLNIKGFTRTRCSLQSNSSAEAKLSALVMFSGELLEQSQQPEVSSGGLSGERAKTNKLFCKHRKTGDERHGMG